MGTNYQNFHWREAKEGLWVRDIDEIEMGYTSLQYYYRGSGRSFFHMTGHLTLEVSVTSHKVLEVGRELDAALEKAWLALRYHHPTIASQVKLDPGTKKYVKVYSTSSNGWLEKSFVIVSSGQTGIEFANNDPPAPALPTLYVVIPPKSGERLTVRRDVVFRSPHDIIDGIGTLLLFENYVRLTANALEKGELFEVPRLCDPQVLKNLSPPYRIAAAVPEIPSKELMHRLNEIAHSHRDNLPNNLKPVVLPYKKGALVPGRHQRVEMILSVSDTSELSAACKSMGYTVTHVLHAAIALVLRDLQPKSQEPRPAQYIGYLLRNERRNCVSPYNDHRHAAAVYHSVSSDKLIIDMSVPAQSLELNQKAEDIIDREEFTRVVENMRRFYLKVRDDPLHYRLAPWLAGYGTKLPPTDPEMIDVIPDVPPPSEAPSVSISSMGRIDDVISHQVGSINVYSPWVTSEELRNSIGLFLGSFRGQLSLSAAYNDAWHDELEVLDILQRCINIARSGLM